MHLSAYNGIDWSLVRQKFGDIIQRPKNSHINALHVELFLQIFSNLNLAALGAICLVSKEWALIASAPILWKPGFCPLHLLIFLILKD